MTTHEAIRVLKRFQKWRLGSDNTEQPHPKEITQAINIAIVNMINNTKKMKAKDFLKSRGLLSLKDESFDNDLIKAVNDFADISEDKLTAISEIENAMERWHLARDNDNETLQKINDILVSIGLLEWHNKAK